MNQPTSAEHETLLNVLGIHAIALVMASQYLESRSDSTTYHEWLQIILQKAHEEYRICHPDRLKAYIAQVMSAIPTGESIE